VRRTMAAEYSRQLSMNIQRTLRQVAGNGNWAGSTPGYGLRRMLVSPDRTHKQLLNFGDQKTLKAGFVTLVPGPKEELEIIRLIYDMRLKERLSIAAIVRELAHRSITRYGHAWSFYTVKHLFTNPKYIGTYVWGRTEWGLRRAPIRLPSDKWMVKPGAFPALIDPKEFRRARAMYYNRTDQKTDEELIAAVRRLWKRHGELSQRLIDNSRLTPCIHTYRRRFGGGVNRIYELVGYHVSKKRRAQRMQRGRRRSLTVRNKLIQRLIKIFRGRIGTGTYDGYISILPHHFEACVSVCPLRRRQGNQHWVIRSRAGQKDVVTVLALLDSSNNKVRKLYVFPRHVLPLRGRLRPDSTLLHKGIRVRHLRDFCCAVVEAHARVAAGPPPELVGVPQIKRHFGVCEKTVQRWICDGLPVERNGRRFRGATAVLEQWAEQNGFVWVLSRDEQGRWLGYVKRPYSKMRLIPLTERKRGYCILPEQETLSAERAYRLTDEGRAKISAMLRTRWLDREKARETGAKISAALRARWANPKKAPKSAARLSGRHSCKLGEAQGVITHR